MYAPLTTKRTTTAAVVESIVRDLVPLGRVVGVTCEFASYEEVRLSLTPTDLARNRLGTVYAGTSFTLAELTAGHFLLALRERLVGTYAAAARERLAEVDIGGDWWGWARREIEASIDFQLEMGGLPRPCSTAPSPTCRAIPTRRRTALSQRCFAKVSPPARSRSKTARSQPSWYSM